MAFQFLPSPVWISSFFCVNMRTSKPRGPRDVTFRWPAYETRILQGMHIMPGNVALSIEKWNEALYDYIFWIFWSRPPVWSATPSFCSTWILTVNPMWSCQFNKVRHCSVLRLWEGPKKSEWFNEFNGCGKSKAIRHWSVVGGAVALILHVLSLLKCGLFLSVGH